MRGIIFTIERDEVVARIYEHDHTVTPKEYILWSVAEYEEFVKDFSDFNMACSSKLDYPQEYTKRRDTIALARWIRA